MPLESSDSSLYPRLIIRLDGLPSQRKLEQLYGPEVFEYTLPLPEYIFDEAPLRRVATRNFIRTTIPPPVDNVSFPPKTESEWREIAVALYDWLRDNHLERERDEWVWTVNIFWIAYSACNPFFPLGKQDSVINWSPKVVRMSCEHVFQRVQGLDLRFKHDDKSWVIWKEWLTLRKVWCQQGVKPSHFESRIGQYL